MVTWVKVTRQDIGQIVGPAQEIVMQGFIPLNCTDALHTYIYFTHTHREKTSQEKPHKNQRHISNVLRNISFI